MGLFDRFKKKQEQPAPAPVQRNSGATVTGQTKVADRGKEAGLAAGSSMFDDLNRKVTDRGKKRPTIIVEKGVPVYIYFTP